MNITAIIITAAISTLVGAGVSAIIGYTKHTRQKTKAIQDGLQSLLRAEIIRQHEKYSERGCCPIYAKEAAKNEYNAYHALGGNGVITELYNDILQLPETAPKQKKEIET